MEAPPSNYIPDPINAGEKLPSFHVATIAANGSGCEDSSTRSGSSDVSLGTSTSVETSNTGDPPARLDDDEDPAVIVGIGNAD